MRTWRWLIHRLCLVRQNRILSLSHHGTDLHAIARAAQVFAHDILLLRLLLLILPFKKGKRYGFVIITLIRLDRYRVLRDMAWLFDVGRNDLVRGTLLCLEVRTACLNSLNVLVDGALWNVE